MSAEEVRADLTTALEDAGIRALPYTAETPRPPCASVVPSDPYMRRATAHDEPPAVFQHVRVGFDVLLLETLREAKPTADAIGSLIEQAWAALKPFRPVRVSQPGEVELSGTRYMGAVITIEQDTKEP